MKSLDCTFPTALGRFNFRVGVIIANGRKVLMARNPKEKRVYFYSVGGRVKFGETMADAVAREMREETGIACEVDRLAAVHENFFMDDAGTPFHELSMYFTLKPNDALYSIENGHRTDHGPDGEYLEWIDLDRCEGITFYPPFFQTMDFTDAAHVPHFVTSEWPEGICP